MSDKKLLPCPFCGGEAEMSLLLGNYGVTCNHCMGAIFPGRGMTQEDAIDYWNTRKPIERILERMEELIIDNVDCYTGEPCNNPCTDCQNNTYGNAIDIVKEEGGLNG